MSALLVLLACIPSPPAERTWETATLPPTGSTAETAGTGHTGAPATGHTGTTPPTPPTPELISDATATTFPLFGNLGTSGDLDADGRWEIAVGRFEEPAWSALSFNGATVSLFREGGVSGGGLIGTGTSAAIDLRGDLTDDGTADVLIGAASPGGYGAVTAVFADPGTGPGYRDWFSGGQFGWDVAAADVSGDGVADLLFSTAAPGDGTAGTVQVVLGGPALAAGTGTEPDAEAWATWRLPELGCSLAASLSAGDLDGDGVHEVLVGSMGDSFDPMDVWALRGNAGVHADLALSANTLFHFVGDGHADGAAIPASVAVTDVDGDGYGDAVLGFPFDGAGAGALYVVSGGASGSFPRGELGPADATARVQGPGALFGAHVAAPWDFDADGAQDVAVTAELEDGDRGAVYLFSGADLRGTIDVAWARRHLLGRGGGYRLGSSISSGDFDFDGAGDLVLGEAPVEPGASGWLLLGTP